MKIQQGSSRPKRAAKERAMQEQLEAAFAEALEWRWRWRTELDAREQAPDAKAARLMPKGRNPEADSRARFAEAVARAELKRFYWGGRREAEFQQARKLRSRPPTPKGTRPG